jgi:hypothetical protein
MANSQESFTYEQQFQEHPGLLGLVNAWGEVFDSWDRQKLSPEEEKELLDQAEVEITELATELLLGHYPSINPNATAEGLSDFTNAKLWATRAMLAANDINISAERLVPEDFHE